MRILDRYALREFVGPFAGCVAGFTVILLSGVLFELTDLILLKRVAARTVVGMLLYRLPSLVVLSLPIAVLFGMLLALGRLARDSELTMFRAAGVPFARVARPLLAAALLVSLAALLANERVVPWANHRYESAYRLLLFRDPIPQIQEQVFFRDGRGTVFYVKRVDTGRRTLQDVMIFEVPASRGEGFPRIVTARRGTFQERVWQLEEVVTRVLDEEGFLLTEAAAGRMAYPLGEGVEVFMGEQKSTSEMTRRELLGHIRLFERGGLNVQAFVVDYHLKLALPFASLVLGLVGAPLSLLGGRSARAVGAGVSVAVAFLYYVVTSVCRSLGAGGALPPLVAAWLPAVLFLAAAAWLLRRADRVGFARA